MGKYKRNKSKPKEKEIFTPCLTVRKYIHKNMDYLVNFPDNIFKIEKRDIENGDRYYGESGFEWHMTFRDGTEYFVGQVTITEDADDWAQAEAYNSDIMRGNDGKSVKGREIMDRLLNIESDYRENRFKEILGK